MCVGVPMQIIAIDGIAATASDGQETQVIDLSLTPEAQVSDWILTFLGSAYEVLSAEQAAKISAALDGLRAVMQGGDAGSAFDDIEQRGPQLPAHLKAALDAGRTTG